MNRHQCNWYSDFGLTVEEYLFLDGPVDNIDYSHLEMSRSHLDVMIANEPDRPSLSQATENRSQHMYISNIIL